MGEHIRIFKEDLKHILNWLKGHKYKVLAVILAFMFMTVILCIGTKGEAKQNEQAKLTEIQLQSSKEFIRDSERIKKTLLVAYDLSDPEAEFYAYWFKKYSYKKVVPWELFAATAYIESKFDPTARSCNNAIGIFQILEPTLKEQCKKNKIDYKPGKSGWTDVINIVGGMSYLAEGYKSSDSNFEYTVKRYIGGAGYVKVKKGGTQEQAINNYYFKVFKEYKRIQYIYAGVKVRG